MLIARPYKSVALVVGDEVTSRFSRPDHVYFWIIPSRRLVTSSPTVLELLLWARAYWGYFPYYVYLVQRRSCSTCKMPAEITKVAMVLLFIACSFLPAITTSEGTARRQRGMGSQRCKQSSASPIGGFAEIGSITTKTITGARLLSFRWRYLSLYKNNLDSLRSTRRQLDATSC